VILRRWRKHFTKKPIPSGEFLSLEDDINYKLYDYWARLLGVEFYDSMIIEIEKMQPRYIEEMVQNDLITKGQWILWTMQVFRSDMRNGGFEQFIGNWPSLGRDVSLCHRQIGLDDLATNFDAIGTKIAPYLGIAFGSSDAKQSTDAYDLMHEKIDASPEAQELNEGFIMTWDTETNSLFWPSDCWCTRLDQALLSFVENNYSEFCTPIKRVY
jgi:hypothetical protein